MEGGHIPVLSEDCIAIILSFTSAEVACTSSFVSTSFKSIADSDAVWEKFVPSEYKDMVSRSVSPIDLTDFPSKKELYRRLCRDPTLLYLEAEIRREEHIEPYSIFDRSHHIGCGQREAYIQRFKEKLWEDLVRRYRLNKALCRRQILKMTDVTKREFAELAFDGNNYLTWAFDIEVLLSSSSLSGTIVEYSQSTKAQKRKSQTFLRYHLHQDLRNEYLTEKGPYYLWTSLNDRFYQHPEKVLSEVHYDWSNIRLQDFKSVTDYNSALQRIVSQSKLWEHSITEGELIQKTLSTFHVNDLLHQQYYMAKNYNTHSELISSLLVLEKYDQLWMKNLDAIHGDSKAIPTEHDIAHKKDSGRRKGKGRHRGSSKGRDQGF